MNNFILKLLFCYLIFPFVSQGQQYNFRTYSVKDGVAQSQVYAMIQDHRGYIWMGTRGGGITRYDGKEFKTYTEKDGLVNNYIYDIKQDRDYNLWICTSNGVSFYNGKSFQNFTIPNHPTQLEVKEIAFDKRNRKWLATNSGVYVLEGSKFIDLSKYIPCKKINATSICIDRNGIVWLGSGSGLYRITEHRGNYKLKKYGSVSHYMNNAITKIKEDASGKLWIGTYGDGIYVKNKEQFYRIDLKLELYKQTILDVYFDQHQNVWLASLTKGVIQYNPKNSHFSYLTEKEGLSNNHVRSIIQDNCGSYWFGTSGGGVCHYFGKQFTTYDKSSGLGGNFIYSIFKDSKKRLWIGNSQKGVSVLDENGFQNFDANHGFQDVKIRAICEDNAGNVYFGADGQGVFVYDGTSFEEVPGLTKKYIRAMLKDDRGNIWIATAGNGLYKLGLANQERELVNFGVSDGLLHMRLTSLHYDKLGRLWYGTEDNGIGFLKNEIIQKQTFRKKDGLYSNYVRCFTEDQSGYLWLGTAGSGISSIAIYQNNFEVKSYNHQDGLSSSNVYLLTCDGKNNLIVGSETGLDYIFLSPERRFKSIKHYSEGEGFTGVETCLNAVFNDPDGSIWFGTINGLSKYNPANLVKNTNEPIINFTDVKLFYESLSKTSYKQMISDWNQVKKLELPHDQNHLSFDFFAVNLNNPEAVRYKWKLLGFDGNWSPPSKEHSIVYSNINPGKYTFLVKSCNEDGIWNKVPAKIMISISAPYWMTWWFISFEVLAAFLFILVVFLLIFRRINAKAQEEQKKLQMAKEIVELEQKALRLQMNPHFIFNALNSIQAQIGSGNEQEARYYLAKFSRLMRQILSNSRNALITLEEEVNTLENYLMIEKFCNGDRFDYAIHVDQDLETDYLKIPPMLIQPFVENAIKHGLKYVENKRGLIEIHFLEKNGMLECSVTDNGIGREKAAELNQNSKETYHQSTSLLVTQERLDLLQESGSSEQLELIDLLDENGQACGTKVIIKIPIN